MCHARKIRCAWFHFLSSSGAAVYDMFMTLQIEGLILLAMPMSFKIIWHPQGLTTGNLDEILAWSWFEYLACGRGTEVAQICSFRHFQIGDHHLRNVHGWYNWYMHASSWYEDLACGWEGSLALSRTNLHFMTLIPALQCIANRLTFINIRCPRKCWLMAVLSKSSTGT